MSDPLDATVLMAVGGYRCVVRSHVGMVRERNEDRVLSRPQIGLWAVADGMGGHQGGEFASQTVVDALNAVAEAGSGWALLSDVEARLKQANATLTARAQALGPGVRIGSTVVALMIFDDHFACLWAGDSRAYLVRHKQAMQLSRDHSVVEDMIEAGMLDRRAAPGHPKANVITRAIGVHADLELDLRHGAVQAGDVFVLCSDGLTSRVAEDEIVERVATLDLEQAADALLQLSLERGAPDNVSLVLVRTG